MENKKIKSTNLKPATVAELKKKIEKLQAQIKRLQVKNLKIETQLLKQEQKMIKLKAENDQLRAPKTGGFLDLSEFANKITDK